MKIIKYSKVNNGFYNIITEEDKIKLHEDIILKYNILSKKEISDEEINLYKKENDKYQAYSLALKYMNTRLRCEKELIDYLSKKEISNAQIKEVIDLLKKQGYLNENTYIKSYINDRLMLSNDGPLKIKNDLLNLGFNNIEEYFSKFTLDFEEERIRKIIEKSIKQNKKSQLQLKIKLNNNLIQLGYNQQLVKDLVNRIKIDDTDIYEKEYKKLEKKYSKKYKDTELKYKIEQALYLKGFRK